MRELTVDECSYVAGGDGDGGDGECAAVSMSCVESASGLTLNCVGYGADGNVVGMMSIGTSVSNSSGGGFSLSLGDAIGIGMLAGTGAGLVSYLLGTAGLLTVGEAMALGAFFGGVAGLAVLGVTAAAIAAYQWQSDQVLLGT